MHKPDNIHSRLPAFKEQYDLIIIGGGIYGATLAWEATSRGLSVVLLEKSDFGSGTSANSLKVIHGGIRYLQELNFARTRESIRERRALLRIAPHLVKPMECVMPTYRQLSKSRLALWGGTTLYDMLAYDRNEGLDATHSIPAGSLLSLKALQSILPDLHDDTITGGARWYDAQATNSERLVLAFLMSAKAQGAHIGNYVEVKALLYGQEQKQIKGVVAEDVLSGESLTLKGSVVVDCSGPWTMAESDNAPDLTGNVSPQTSRKTRAVNLVVNRKIAPCAVGVKTRIVEGPDNTNRLLFITPWREGSIVGTWYFEDNGQPEDQAITDKELASCIAQVNSALPALNLCQADVTRVHLGRLPVEANSPKTGEPQPQKNFQIISAAEHGRAKGLFQVQGVKYTTARDVAKCVLDAVSASLSAPLQPSATHKTPLYGGDIIDSAAFLAQCQQRYRAQLSTETLNNLVNNYGSKVDDIVRYAIADPLLAEIVPGTQHMIKAELRYVIDHEMVCTLSDLVLRRTELGSFAIPKDEAISYCVDFLADALGWDQALKVNNVQELRDNYPVWVSARQPDSVDVGNDNI